MTGLGRTAGHGPGLEDVYVGRLQLSRRQASRSVLLANKHLIERLANPTDSKVVSDPENLSATFS